MGAELFRVGIGMPCVGAGTLRVETEEPSHSACHGFPPQESPRTVHIESESTSQVAMPFFIEMRMFAIVGQIIHDLLIIAWSVRCGCHGDGSAEAIV